MAKIAKLVAVSLMTRVVVDELATDEEILDAARSQFMEKISTELGENLEFIEDDTECPYGALLSDEPYHKKKNIVERFLRFILPEDALQNYLEEVYDNEECGNDSLDAILSNAWWWHTGGETKNYHVDNMPVGDETDDVYCVINDEDEDEEIGNVTLSSEEAEAMNLQY